MNNSVIRTKLHWVECEGFGAIRVAVYNNKNWFSISDMERITEYRGYRKNTANYVSPENKIIVAFTSHPMRMVNLKGLQELMKSILHMKSKALEEYLLTTKISVTDQVTPTVTKTVTSTVTDNDLVEVKNNQVVVSSRQIAENFGKEHKHVLESIREIITAENSALTLFQESLYVSGTGKSYPEYLMNRDGSSLLVMGFSGKQALRWKLKYIAAFNAMEKQLETSKHQSLSTDDLIDKQIQLQGLVYKAQSSKKATIDAVNTTLDKVQALVDQMPDIRANKIIDLVSDLAGTTN